MVTTTANGSARLGTGWALATALTLTVTLGAENASADITASILPSSRSVQVGGTASAFVTIINAGSEAASACGIAPATDVPASFSYQTTDPATNAPVGTVDTPVDVAVGASQSYVIAFVPSQSFDITQVQFSFDCTNTDPAPIYAGVNTLTLSASDEPVPDIVSVSATVDEDGIVRLANESHLGVFAVATTNVGAGADMVVSPGGLTDTATALQAVEGVAASVCQLDAESQCLAPPSASVELRMESGATAAFGIFLAATEPLAVDLVNNRVNLLARDANQSVRGATSVAVQDEDRPPNTLPEFVAGTVQSTYYDGESDDLLTGGLGKTGLAGAAPAFADPLNPTSAELRRNTIYSNWRALTDMTEAGGYGRIYGPNIDANGQDTGTEGLIAGWEHLAFGDDGSGQEMVTLMIQIPDSFDTKAPCIITGPGSGSRTAYGAIGTSGDWGLKRGCAVAYTDAGHGVGFHDLQRNRVSGLDGTRQSADQEGSNFTADLSQEDRATFNSMWPNRYAVKHAHSKRNPEASWGRHVLWSIELAFYALNERFGTANADGDIPVTIAPANTLVIASSISNGATASLQAAEQDTQGLIDGLAISEPNAQVPPGGDFSIVQGAQAPIDNTVHSKGLLDYFTFLNLYQPCANLAPENADAPFNTLPAEVATARCTGLEEKGLLEASTTEAQATEAQAKINAFGYPVEQNRLQPAVTGGPQFQPAIAVTYTNAHGRFDVTDNLCGFSFGATDATTGAPMELSQAADAALFSTSSGVPPSGGVNLIYHDSVGGPIDQRLGVSPSTARADWSFDGAMCFREQFSSERVQQGVQEVRVSGSLRGLPSVVVAGRADEVVPVNHGVRPYYATNKLVEADGSRLSYYEIKEAHHLDVFNAFPGFAEFYVPLDHYFKLAVDLMYDHLRNGTPLPPSQVVRPTPRGDGAPPLQLSDLPDIDPSPVEGDQITFTGAGGELRIPE